MSDTFEHRAGEHRAGESGAVEDQRQPAGAVDDTEAAHAGAPVQNEPSAQLTNKADGTRPGFLSASSWRAFRDPLLIGILLTALIADQLTKQLVLNTLGPGMSWPDSGFFRFTFVRNDGTAFGLFQNNGALLTAVSLGAIALIVYFYREAAMASWFTRAALGLQLGGAAGNIIDRFRHGYVVDFIDVGSWPIFNIADSSIMVGIISLVAYFAFRGDRNGQKDAGGDSEGVATANPGDTPVSDATAFARPGPSPADAAVPAAEPRD